MIEIIITPKRLMKNPIFAICAILTLPVPNIIALGGVATGIINAIEAEMVAGIINKSGLMPIAAAVAAKIGSNVCVVAVFEVSSVKKVNRKQTAITIKNGEMLSNPVKERLMIRASSVFLNASAMANPPPKRIITSHGTLENAFASAINSPGLLFDGMMNISNAMTIAMVLSSILLPKTRRFDQPGILMKPRFKSLLNIHKRATERSRKVITLSS